MKRDGELFGKLMKICMDIGITVVFVSSWCIYNTMQNGGMNFT